MTIVRVFALALLFAASSFAKEPFGARVIGITDGDTLTVLTASKEQVKVRFFGVDAPEKGQPYSDKAKAVLGDLAFGKDVTVKLTGKADRQREIGDVVLADGRSVSREMVRSGWAWHAKQFAPKDRELAELQMAARTAKRGLWADPLPIPPWDWRHNTGDATTSVVVGNSNSKIYHTPGCNSSARMLAKNRVEFASCTAAEAAGYRKASDCSK